MGWLGGIVSFIFLWAFCLLVVLPRGQATQAERGAVEPGTPASAPAEFKLGRRLLYTTLITLAIWSLVFATVTFEWLTLSDFDLITPKSIRDGAG